MPQKMLLQLILTTFLTLFFSHTIAMAEDPLAEQVTLEINSAINAGLENHAYPFPSQPLIIELLGPKPIHLEPPQLTSVAKGLAAVYPDFDLRSSGAENGEVINKEGYIVREIFAILLVESEALTRATETKEVIKALVKFLSLEVSSNARAATINALKTAPFSSLLEISRGLSAIASQGEDVFGVSELEMNRAANSLEAIVEQAGIVQQCPIFLQMQTLLESVPKALRRPALVTTPAAP